MSDEKKISENVYKLFIPDLPVPVRTAVIIFVGAVLFVTLPVWGAALFLCLMFWLIYVLGKNAVELGEKALGEKRETKKSDGAPSHRSDERRHSDSVHHSRPGATGKRYRGEPYQGGQGKRVFEENSGTRTKGVGDPGRADLGEDNPE